MLPSAETLGPGAKVGGRGTGEAEEEGRGVVVIVVVAVFFSVIFVVEGGEVGV